MESRVILPRRTFHEGLRQLLKHRRLLIIWTLREIRARYRQSALGVGWALIQPLFQLIVISIVFGRLLKVSSGDSPYPVFALVAIVPWTFFASTITSSIPSIVANMDLVTKIYFPREIFPLSAIMARLVDTLIASLLLVVMMIYYNLPLHQTAVFVPLLLIIQIIFSLAVGLLGSAINVFLRDISFAAPILIQIWMYLTPVIYPLDMVPAKWRSLYLLNPMAGLIDSYRCVLIDGTYPNFAYIGYSAFISVFLCAFAYWNFKRLEMAMSDII